MAQWADFSDTPPGAAALLNAGFVGVIRYTGLGGDSKRIHASEYMDYSRNGMPVLLVAELGTSDAWAALDDYATGVVRAQQALADARAEGIPDYVGIACAADAHTTSATQISDAVQYATGFASVLGVARTGFYGFAETSRAVHDAGVVGWHWRCGSAPSAADAQWVNFWQRNDGSRMVNGADCDINETYVPIGDDMTPEEHEWLRQVWAVVGDAFDPTTGANLGTRAKAVDDRTVRIETKVDTLITTLSADESAIITAVRAQPTGGQVDVHALATALAPLLPAGLSKADATAAALVAVQQVFAKGATA